nr:sugar transporter [Rubellimicrobium arenae]
MTETRPRVLVALAGAPGAGKSTMASALHRRLTAQRYRAEVVPLDGFLLDSAVLEGRGLRQRKGAPETFDIQGFLHLVHRLKAGGEVVAPIFDRARDLAVAGAQVVPADCQIVICEGNYLLFDEAPWRDLVPLWDLSARLDVPLRELRARLIQRWLDHGLSRAAATRRAEINDVPNAERILRNELPAHLLLATRPGERPAPPAQSA